MGSHRAELTAVRVGNEPRVFGRRGEQWMIGAPSELSEIQDAVSASRTLGAIAAGGPNAVMPDVRSLKVQTIVAAPYVKVSTADGNRADVQIGIDSARTFWSVSPDFDHVVAGDRWIPLDSGSLASCRDLVRRLDGLSWRESTIVADLEPGLLRLDGAYTSAPTTDRLEIPASLRGTLYEYQHEGYSWISSMVLRGVGALLADEMGLGKTLTVLAVVARMKESAGSVRALLVVPVTLIPNWVREARRFTPDLSFFIQHGPDRIFNPAELRELEADVVITTYDTLVSDIPTFEQVPFELLVVDEIQNAKNPDTRRWAALNRVNRNACIAVTGTPIENSIMDLSATMAIATPRIVPDPKRLARTLTDRTAAAAAWVAPLMIRRRVVDVADDLPDRVDQTLWLQMLPDEELAYSRVVESTTDLNPLVAIQQLQAASTHVDLVATTGLFAKTVIEHSAKVDTLVQLLTEVDMNGGRSIVFSARHRLTDSLAERLATGYGRSVVVIDGRTDPGERQRIVDSFNISRKGSVLIASPRAAGVGLNIQGANHVFHLSLEWNPATMKQAEARAYRRGQERSVFVHRLVYPDTVDELIIKRLGDKTDLFDEVIEAGSGPKSTDIGELRELWRNRGLAVPGR